MIKHPALRVRSVLHIVPAVLDAMAVKMEQLVALTPFADLVTDISVPGSYARECAELHSDLDLNLDTGTEENRLLARKRIKENKPQFRKALAFLRSLEKQYGIRIDIALQHADIKAVPKMSYSLRTRTLFGTERRKMDVDWQTGVATERIRPPLLRQPKLSIGVPDDDLGARPFNPLVDDPWLSELPTWRRRYGANLLEYGKTPETAHMLP